MRNTIIAIAMVPMVVCADTNIVQGQEGAQIINQNQRVLATLDRLVNERISDAINERLSDAVLMTDEECANIGEGWVPYDPIGGRFAIAAGKGDDEREESVSFSPGDTGGTYRHRLTVLEMPEHAHSYIDYHFNNDRRHPDRGDDDDRERHLVNPRRDTATTGGNRPHNNMPPYLVLNFCHIP